VHFVKPERAYLAGYRDALERGWSPTSSEPERRRAEHLTAIEADPERFLAGLARSAYGGSRARSSCRRPCSAMSVTVVPWRQRRGYATRALGLLLPEAAAAGLPYVEVTTDADNLASQRVATANGGELVKHFTLPDAYGSTPALRYRVPTGRQRYGPGMPRSSRAVPRRERA